MKFCLILQHKNYQNFKKFAEFETLAGNITEQ
jgi:hypothetical protein